ncbi:MAG: M42 family metallopeptidase [Candidatus Methanomethylicia archaeon]
MVNLDYLAKLSNAFGPPGFEDEVRDLLKMEFEKFADEVKVDRLGNLIGYLHGDSSLPKIMIAAHMDEVGFLITNVSDKGFLYFHPLGGVVAQIIPGQIIKIKGRSGFVYGVVGSTPPHITPPERRDKVPPIEDMYIDVGATSIDEVKARGLDIGCPAVFHTEFRDLGLGYIFGKAFDDRIGCLILVELLQKLKNSRFNVVFVATVQEEVGLRGARTAAWIVEPDYAIAIEGTFAADTPDVKSHQIPAFLKRGPVLTIADAGMIAHPKVLKVLMETADRNNIPYQFKRVPSGSTDAAAIHLTRGGVPSGVIAVPCRYIHGSSAIAHVDDIKASINLALKCIEGLSVLER